MTRGKRTNPITLSGRARQVETEEVTIRGSKTALLDQLYFRGLLSERQRKAGVRLLEDHARVRSNFEKAMKLLPPQMQRHLETLLVKQTTLVDYGKTIQGYKRTETCEEWALERLQVSLTELSRMYSLGRID
jgi:hypothetical protein